MYKYKGKLAAFVSLLAVIFAMLGGVASPASASVPDWDLAGASASNHSMPPGGGLFKGQDNPAKRQAHEKVHKSMPPSPFTGPGYYYGGAVQSSLPSGVYGLNGKIWIANPYMEANSGEHTLMEYALYDSVHNNTVEIGWTKDGSGAGGPRLFVYYWNNGVPGNCYFGCAIYHDNGSNPINVGADLSTVATGCNGTSTLNCVKLFQMQLTTGPCGAASSGVFFYYDGVNFGCIEASGLPNTATFDTAYAFSEVYFGGANKPKTDMGNGKYAASPLSAGGSAFFSSISYVGTATLPNLSMNTDTDSSAYSSMSVGSSGNRSFAGGSGPGYKLSGGVWVTPGDIGS